ncbi:MAG: UpxY family transcription antiterminator [Cyclobacteriaceae bacterium]
MSKSWFVFYTKSRHEKKVKDLLEKRGFEVFLPTHKVLRQWSDRKKKVEVPLFNSYIFVNTEEHKVVDVLQVPGVSWTIRHNGKPAVLHEREYELINRFLETGLTLEIFATPELETGDKVKVVDGPLRGMYGMLVATTEGNRFVVALESIGQSMRVLLEPHLMQRI